MKKLAWNSTFKKLRSWHPFLSLHGKQMGKKWKQWDFIFLGSKITADGDWSHEIKRCLFLRRKAMTNLGSVLKSRDVTLPTKVHMVHIVKAMVFLAVMYGCELDHKEGWGWAPKNWCFWTVVLEKTLESLGLQDQTSQSIKEINPEYSSEGQMLKLKLQYSGHLMQRADSLEKTLMLRKIEKNPKSTH